MKECDYIRNEGSDEIGLLTDMSTVASIHAVVLNEVNAMLLAMRNEHRLADTGNSSTRFNGYFHATSSKPAGKGTSPYSSRARCNEPHPLLLELCALRDRIITSTRFVVISREAFVLPFLNIIRSSDASGVITYAALGSILCFLRHNIISVEAPGAEDAITEIADAVTHCRFDSSESSDSDVMVLIKIVQVLSACMQHKAATWLPDAAIWDMFQACYKLSFGQMTGSLALQSIALEVMYHLVHKVFGQLPHIMKAGHDPGPQAARAQHCTMPGPCPPFRHGIPCMVKLFAFLCREAEREILSPSDNVGQIVPFCLKALKEAVQAAGRSLEEVPALLVLVQDDLGRAIIGAVRFRDIREDNVLTMMQSALQLTCVLWAVLRRRLKMQFQTFLSDVFLTVLHNSYEKATASQSDRKQTDESAYMFDVNALMASIPLDSRMGEKGPVLGPFTERSYIETELVLECLSDLLSDDSTLPDLFVNYDCDQHSQDITVELFHALAVIATARLPVEEELMVSHSMTWDDDGNLSGLALKAIHVSIQAIHRRRLVARQGGPHETSSSSDSHEATADLAGDILRGSITDNLFTLFGRAQDACEKYPSLISLPLQLLRRGHGDVTAVPITMNPEALRNTHTILQCYNLPLQKLKETKLQICQGARLFNTTAKKGLQYLQTTGILPTPLTAKAVAKFLRSLPQGLNKTAVGEYIGAAGKGITNKTSLNGQQFEGHSPAQENTRTLDVYEGDTTDFHAEVLQEFVSTFDFRSQSLLDSLRMFLSSFRLPGEAQQIDRILQAFAAAVFMQCVDRRYFATVDVAYLLSFSIIMLNTDLHNPNIRPEKKMSLKDFLINNSNYGYDVSKGVVLPEEYLCEIYQSIASCQIRTCDDGLKGEITGDRWKDLLRLAESEASYSDLIAHEWQDFYPAYEITISALTKDSAADKKIDHESSTSKKKKHSKCFEASETLNESARKQLLAAMQGMYDLTIISALAKDIVYAVQGCFCYRRSSLSDREQIAWLRRISDMGLLFAHTASLCLSPRKDKPHIPATFEMMASNCPNTTEDERICCGIIDHLIYALASFTPLISNASKGAIASRSQPPGAFGLAPRPLHSGAGKYTAAPAPKPAPPVLSDQQTILDSLCSDRYRLVATITLLCIAKDEPHAVYEGWDVIIECLSVLRLLGIVGSTQPPVATQQSSLIPASLLLPIGGPLLHGQERERFLIDLRGWRKRKKKEQLELHQEDICQADGDNKNKRESLLDSFVWFFSGSSTSFSSKSRNEDILDAEEDWAASVGSVERLRERADSIEEFLLASRDHNALSPSRKLDPEKVQTTGTLPIEGSISTSVNTRLQHEEIKQELVSKAAETTKAEMQRNFVRDCLGPCDLGSFCLRTRHLPENGLERLLTALIILSGGYGRVCREVKDSLVTLDNLHSSFMLSSQSLFAQHLLSNILSHAQSQTSERALFVWRLAFPYFRRCLLRIATGDSENNHPSLNESSAIDSNPLPGLALTGTKTPSLSALPWFSLTDTTKLFLFLDQCLGSLFTLLPRVIAAISNSIGHERGKDPIDTSPTVNDELVHATELLEILLHCMEGKQSFIAEVFGLHIAEGVSVFIIQFFRLVNIYSAEHIMPNDKHRIRSLLSLAIRTAVYVAIYPKSSRDAVGKDLQISRPSVVSPGGNSNYVFDRVLRTLEEVVDVSDKNKEKILYEFLPVLTLSSSLVCLSCDITQAPQSRISPQQERRVCAILLSIVNGNSTRQDLKDNCMSSSSTETLTHLMRRKDRELAALIRHTAFLLFLFLREKRYESLQYPAPLTSQEMVDSRHETQGQQNYTSSVLLLHAIGSLLRCKYERKGTDVAVRRLDVPDEHSSSAVQRHEHSREEWTPLKEFWSVWVWPMLLLSCISNPMEYVEFPYSRKVSEQQHSQLRCEQCRDTVKCWEQEVENVAHCQILLALSSNSLPTSSATSISANRPSLVTDRELRSEVRQLLKEAAQYICEPSTTYANERLQIAEIVQDLKERLLKTCTVSDSEKQIEHTFKNSSENVGLSDRVNVESDLSGKNRCSQHAPNPLHQRSGSPMSSIPVEVFNEQHYENSPPISTIKPTGHVVKPTKGEWSQAIHLPVLSENEVGDLVAVLDELECIVTSQ